MQCVKMTRPGQAEATRKRLVEGAITVLAESGITAVTHRTVAAAAGLSLASTTYHFETKADLLNAAAGDLLDDYRASSEELYLRLEAGEMPDIRSVEALTRYTVVTELHQHRRRAVAWAELMLRGARGAGRREDALQWYQSLTRLWLRAGQLFSPGFTAEQARHCVDTAVGLVYLLKPVLLPEQRLTQLLNGEICIDAAIGPEEAAPAMPVTPSKLRRGTGWQRVLEATVRVYCQLGEAEATYAAIAKEAGVSRSAPAQYVSTIGDLIAEARRSLFREEEQRRTVALEKVEDSLSVADALADFAAAFFLSEVLTQSLANTGTYASHVAAARNPERGAEIAAVCRSRYIYWYNRLEAVGVPAEHRCYRALRCQAIFSGMMIRCLIAGGDIATLTWARSAFFHEITALLTGETAA